MNESYLILSTERQPPPAREVISPILRALRIKSISDISRVTYNTEPLDLQGRVLVSMDEMEGPVMIDFAGQTPVEDVEALLTVDYHWHLRTLVTDDEGRAWWRSQVQEGLPETVLGGFSMSPYCVQFMLEEFWNPLVDDVRPAMTKFAILFCGYGGPLDPDAYRRWLPTSPWLTRLQHELTPLVGKLDVRFIAGMPD
jgi:hypothetical protein